MFKVLRAIKVHCAIAYFKEKISKLRSDNSNVLMYGLYYVSSTWCPAFEHMTALAAGERGAANMICIAGHTAIWSWRILYRRFRLDLGWIFSWLHIWLRLAETRAKKWCAMLRTSSYRRCCTSGTQQNDLLASLQRQDVFGWANVKVGVFWNVSICLTWMHTNIMNVVLKYAENVYRQLNKNDYTMIVVVVLL